MGSSAASKQRTLRLVLGDQLTRDISSLGDLDPATDTVLMAEVDGECTYVRHHPKKIVFVLSAMRHFARTLRSKGVPVEYRQLDDANNSGSLTGELLEAVRRHRPDCVVVTEPGEWRIREIMRGWERSIGVPVETREDDRFNVSTRWFAQWAEGRKSLRMEHFYREMRRRTGLLMSDTGHPIGGKWNFDADNRKTLPEDTDPPRPIRFEPDPITRGVMDLVQTRFSDHFGKLEPFWFAVTEEQAHMTFEAFVRHGFPFFGDYQDTMKLGHKTLFHSVISPYLNAGLLDPLQVCRRVEAEFIAGRAPLNAAEGFIRQIIGWREFVRGLYWLKMPGYADTNFFGATRRVPGFYWTGGTPMNCLRQCIAQTEEEAYAHHIQRLMVTGNFALLAGLAPKEVCEWYLAVYADAFEWVELPNTHGMALFADGGVLGSKPYAASGKYINRMSDYCRSCRYSVNQTFGPNACPFNFLYWNFLAEHRAALAENARMKLVYAALDRMPDDRTRSIRNQAQEFLNLLK